MSPDGSLLVTCTHKRKNRNYFPEGYDESVQIRDMQNNFKWLTSFSGFRAVTSACFSPDGSRFVLARENVQVFDVHNKFRTLATTGSCVTSRIENDYYEPYIHQVCFSPDGTCLIAGCRGGIKVWDAQNAHNLYAGSVVKSA